MLPNSSQNLPDDFQRRYKFGMLCVCRTRIEIRTVGDLESLAISPCAFRCRSYATSARRTGAI